MIIRHTHLSRRSLRLKTAFVTALRRVETVGFIVLTLRTACGREALGSAPATEAITGESLDSIETTLRHRILPLLVDKPIDLADMLDTLSHCIAGNSSAKAAADMALYSLAAQEKQQPLHRLLDATASLPVKTAVTVSLDTPLQMQKQARSLYASGYDILKIKVGSNDGQDIHRIQSIAAALPYATLLVDANQAWSVSQALKNIDTLQPLNLALIEQPVAAKELDALKEITEHSPFPILADEAVFNLDDAKRIVDHGIADLINIKLMKCGGINGALAIIHLCERHDVSCMLGSMLEGPVSIEAALHLAMAFPRTLRWIDLDSPLLLQSLPAHFPFDIEGNLYTWKAKDARVQNMV